MARDILAVPIAGVGCERIFSEAGDVVTYRRNRLNPSTVSDIMISKLHWKNSRNEMSLISDVADEENVEELMAEKEDAQLAEMFGFSDVEDTAVDEDDYNSADERLEVPVSRQRREYRQANPSGSRPEGSHRGHKRSAPSTAAVQPVQRFYGRNN